MKQRDRDSGEHQAESRQNAAFGEDGRPGLAEGHDVVDPLDGPVGGREQGNGLEDLRCDFQRPPAAAQGGQKHGCQETHAHDLLFAIEDDTEE